ncbi:hypothetical protein [Idiomarina sp.]|uniref:hypothetical protein n=1 Tax=Idiomarina sp. TaxID=1874361 RepID=UPI003A93093F
MADVRESYKAMTLRILSNFQLLELTLKLYIGRAYELIGLSLNGRMHFDYSVADVENFPLERLLNVFGKLNGNRELLERLNKLRAQRNHVAHESLIIVMGTIYDKEVVQKKHGEFFYLEDELTECLDLVVEETKALHSGFAGK